MGKIGNEFVKKTTIRSNTFDIKLLIHLLIKNTILLVIQVGTTFLSSSKSQFVITYIFE